MDYKDEIKEIEIHTQGFGIRLLPLSTLGKGGMGQKGEYVY